MRYRTYIFVLCLSILAWASFGIKPASAWYNTYNGYINGCNCYNSYGYNGYSLVPPNQYGGGWNQNPYYGYGWSGYGNYGYNNYNYGWNPIGASISMMLFGGGYYNTYNPYVWY